MLRSRRQPAQKSRGGRPRQARGSRAGLKLADPRCSRTRLPCLHPDVRFRRRSTSPTRQGQGTPLERVPVPFRPDRLSRELGTRERAGPEAGLAVAGISPASGFLGRTPRFPSRLAGPAVFPHARPPRDAALGRREAAGLRAPPRAAPGDQPENPLQPGGSEGGVGSGVWGRPPGGLWTCWLLNFSFLTSCSPCAEGTSWMYGVAPYLAASCNLSLEP